MKQPSEMTDRELDVAVAVEVMGWPWLMDTFQTGPMRFLAKPDGNYGAAGPWNGDPMEILDTTDGFAPSTSIADAMKVHEAMKDRGWLTSLNHCWNGWVATAREYRVIYGDWATAMLERGLVQADAYTLPRVICLAALMAVRSRAALESAALSAIRAASKEQQEQKQ